MTFMRSTFLVACLLLGELPFVSAQSEDSLDNKTVAANSAYQEKDWPKAALLYDQLAHAQPESYRSWYRLGVCLQRTGQHQKALEAFEKAQAKGAPGPSWDTTWQRHTRRWGDRTNRWNN